MDDKLAKLDEENSQTSSEIAHTWATGQETLLAAIADRANGMRWMHDKMYKYYSNWNYTLMLPSIIISTLAGSATIGISSIFPPDYQPMAGKLIGLLTLSTGILTTINQYMKSAQLSENHRIMCVAYGKLHRVISSELALRRDQRPNALEFLRVIRAEQDRLQDVEPGISEHIISKFRKTFDIRADLEKPEIAGDLDHVQVNRAQKNGFTVITPQQIPYTPNNGYTPNGYTPNYTPTGYIPPTTLKTVQPPPLIPSINRPLLSPPSSAPSSPKSLTTEQLQEITNKLK